MMDRAAYQSSLKIRKLHKHKHFSKQRAQSQWTGLHFSASSLNSIRYE